MAVIPMHVLPHYGRHRRMGLNVLYLPFPHNTGYARRTSCRDPRRLSAFRVTPGIRHQPTPKSAEAGYTRT